MLVLGRKENQSILIGENIRITIVGRSSSSIRIGVEAPSDVRVMRAELVPELPSGSSDLPDGCSHSNHRTISRVA